MGTLRRIPQGKKGNGHCSRHLRKSRQQLLRLKHPHIGGSQAQIRGLEHHLRGGNGGVDLAVVLSVGLPLPGDGGIIRHRHKHRRVEMAAHAGVRFLQRLGRAKHKDALRLKVVGGGGIPAGLQNKGQLLRFHRPVAELPQGIAGGGQYVKIHR